MWSLHLPLGQRSTACQGCGFTCKPWPKGNSRTLRTASRYHVWVRMVGYTRAVSAQGKEQAPVPSSVGEDATELVTLLPGPER